MGKATRITPPHIVISEKAMPSAKPRSKTLIRIRLCAEPKNLEREPREIQERFSTNSNSNFYGENDNTRTKAKELLDTVNGMLCLFVEYWQTFRLSLMQISSVGNSNLRNTLSLRCGKRLDFFNMMRPDSLRLCFRVFRKDGLLP